MPRLAPTRWGMVNWLLAHDQRHRDEVRVCAWMRKHGPIPAARISSAKPAGGWGPYWGAVRYNIVEGRGEKPRAKPLHKANSDRRSYSLVSKDVDALVEQHGGFVITSLGFLRDEDLDQCLDWIAQQRLQEGREG